MRIFFKPDSVDTAYNALKDIVENTSREAMGEFNLKKAAGLDIKFVLKAMRKIYTI